MKEFLATWIVIQLLFIGVAGVAAHNETVDGTLDCTDEKVSTLTGVAFPLVFFINNDFVDDYCEQQAKENQ